MVGRIVGEPLEADHDMRLFQAPLQPALAADVARLGGDRPLGRPGEAAEPRPGLVEDALMLHRAGRAHDHPAAAIMAGQVGADPIAVEGRHARRAFPGWRGRAAVRERRPH